MRDKKLQRPFKNRDIGMVIFKQILAASMAKFKLHPPYTMGHWCKGECIVSLYNYSKQEDC